AKRQNLGVIFVPGDVTHVNGTKVLVVEFCPFLDHVFMRFDHSGVGSTGVEKWRNYVLFGSRLGGWLLLHVAIACPEMRVALIGITIAINGMETQFNELLVESFIKEAKPWCLLHNPLLVRALLGMKGGVLLDLQVADLVVCTDVDVICQKRDHQ
ncbi:hypothetical protein EI555_008138, partial [Monodon monoceros]